MKLQTYTGLCNHITEALAKDVEVAGAGAGAVDVAGAEEAGLSGDLALFLKAKPGMISHQKKKTMSLVSAMNGRLHSLTRTL